MRLPFRSRLLCFLFLVAASVVAIPARAQCPPDSVCKNCPTNMTGKAGTTVTVPLFSVGKTSQPLWLWIDCMSLGLCWSDIHTHNGALLEINPIDTNPVNENVIWEFHDEDEVHWDYTTESDASGSLWITQEMEDRLETENGTATKEYQIVDAGTVHQMLSNPGSSPLTCERSMVLSEPLSLAQGGQDEDGLLNMAGARVHLTNNGNGQAHLKITIRDEAPAGGILQGSGELMVHPVRSWSQGRPAMNGFVSPWENNGRAVNNRGSRRPLDQIQIRLNPGESWNGILPADEVYVEIKNLGPNRAELDKTISMDRVDQMDPGSSLHLACIQAGSMTDNITVIGDGSLEHVAATARAVSELPQGVQITGIDLGFEHIIHEGQIAIQVSNVRYIKIGNKVWCWGTTHFSGSIHRHYNTGTSLDFNAQVPIPATALPGDTFMIWYRYTVMIGGMTVIDSCHTTVTVAACAPSELDAKTIDTGVSGLRLLQNVPNPFRASTTIQYELERSGPVTIDIFAVDGRLVRRLIDEALPAGRYEAAWEGRDNSGSAVAGGIYFYRLTTPDGGTTRRMLFLR